MLTPYPTEIASAAAVLLDAWRNKDWKAGAHAAWHAEGYALQSFYSDNQPRVFGAGLSDDTFSDQEATNVLEGVAGSDGAGISPLAIRVILFVAKKVLANLLS